MSRSLTLLGVDDVTDETSQAGTETQAITDFVGQLVKRRRFLIQDNVGEISPFSAKGLLALNNWRNQSIRYIDIDSQIQFDGAMNTVSLNIGSSYQVEINATESIGTLLAIIVEENSTDTTFEVNGAHLAGDPTIAIDTGGTTLNTGTIVSFKGDLYPRYQIVSVSGSPTTLITLDRPLEVDIPDNAEVRVSSPVTKTAPASIRDTLTTIGLGSFLGNSFDNLDTSDTSNGYLFYINVIIEESITVATHIAKLLELSNSYLTVSETGQIDILRDLAYDDSGVTNEFISADEIITPAKLSYSVERLLLGYNNLHVNAAGDGLTVLVVTNTADPIYTNQWANKKYWNPIDNQGSLIGAYKYLYADAATANFFGNQVLDYFKVPRAFLTCTIKGFYHNLVERPVLLQVGKQMFLSMKLEPSGVNQLFDEPARVISYTKNIDQNFYPQVTLQLNNWILPGFVLPEGNAITPVVMATFNINTGAAVTMDTIGDRQLFVEIYDVSMSLIATQVKSRLNGFITNEQPSGDYFQITGFTNGTSYFYKLFTKINNQTSNKTDFISFTPELVDHKIGQTGIGVYNIG